MFSKSYLVLVIAFVIFGITLQTSAVSNSQEELPQNAIIDAIEKLIERVSALEEEAIKEFSKALDKLETFVKDTLSTFSREASKTIEKFIDGVIAAKDEAVKLGVDISKCAVDQSIAELNNIPDLFLNQTIKCTDSVVYSASGYVDKSVNKLNDTINEVKELVTEASKCGLNPVCWTKLDAKVVKDAVSIPLKIAALVTDTVKLIYNLEGEVLKCKVGYGTKATAEAVKIATNVTNCILNAIKNKNI